jgi:hypothetical protein
MRHIGIVGNWALADVKPDDLRAATEKLIVETQAKYDAIAAVKVDDVSFENCIRVRKCFKTLYRAKRRNFDSRCQRSSILF